MNRESYYLVCPKCKNAETIVFSNHMTIKSNRAKCSCGWNGWEVDCTKVYREKESRDEWNETTTTKTI